MSEEIAKQASNIWITIAKSNSILLNLHPTPDQDSLGSALGLKNILEKMGKKVTVFSSDPIGKETSETAELMKGFKEIVFSGFNELDLADYDLFIVLDSDAPHRISRGLELKFPLSIPTIVIDHHQSNDLFGDLNLVIKEGYCTSELLYWLCKQGNVPVNREAALCWFIGMVFDTGQFRYPGPTSSNTYRAAADLIDIGQIDFSKLIWSSLSKKNSIMKVIGLGEYRIETYCAGKILISRLTNKDLLECGLTPESMNSVYRILSDTLSNSRDSVIIAVIYESGEKWGVSLRGNNSNDYKDVSLIAKRVSGGGGHARAAGMSLSGTLEEVKQQTLSLITQVYPELGTP